MGDDLPVPVNFPESMAWKLSRIPEVWTEKNDSSSYADFRAIDTLRSTHFVNLLKVSACRSGGGNTSIQWSKVGTAPYQDQQIFHLTGGPQMMKCDMSKTVSKIGLVIIVTIFAQAANAGDDALRELAKVLRPYKLTPFAPPEQGWGPGGVIGKRHFHTYAEPYAAPEKFWKSGFDYQSIYKFNDVQISDTDRSKSYDVSLTSDFLLDQVPLNFEAVFKYVKDAKVTLTGTRYLRLLENDLIANRDNINTDLLSTRAPLSGRPLWVPLKTLIVDELSVTVTVKPSFSATVSSANLFQAIGVEEGVNGEGQSFAYKYSGTTNTTLKFVRKDDDAAMAVAWGEALPLTEDNIAILKGETTSDSFLDRPEEYLDLEAEIVQ